MDQVIVYPHQTLEGEIVVIYPNMNCGLTVEQIALKDVPPSVPYIIMNKACLLYTSPSPRDRTRSRMPSSA